MPSYAAQELRHSGCGWGYLDLAGLMAGVGVEMDEAFDAVPPALVDRLRKLRGAGHLVMHPDEVVTKTALSEHIYEEDADRDSNVIEVFIGRLRKKIDPGGGFNPIETLRGRGYRFEPHR